MTELEELGGDTSPAAVAYRARNADWHDTRETAETQLADLEAAGEPDTDPTLLDELPYLTENLAAAPPELLAQLITPWTSSACTAKIKTRSPSGQPSPPPPSPHSSPTPAPNCPSPFHPWNKALWQQRPMIMKRAVRSHQ